MAHIPQGVVARLVPHTPQVSIPEDLALCVSQPAAYNSEYTYT